MKPARIVRVIYVALVAAFFAVQAAPAHAAFPGENGKIAFTCDGEFGAVCTINPDGSDLRTLAEESEVNIGYSAWSPDGTRILYRHGRCHLCVMTSEGANRTQLPLSGSRAGWSPDGAKVVFEDSGLFTANIDGSNLSSVTSGQPDNTPAWSPTGSKIAFIRDGSDAVGDVIYTIRPDGTGLTSIIEVPALYENIDWSPDSSRLIFATTGGSSDGSGCELLPDSPPGCGEGIWIVNQDGSGLRKLVDGDENAVPLDPAFSPDGTRIVFTISYQAPESGAPTGDGLYTMNADGSSVSEIVRVFGHDNASEADWQPLPFKNASRKCKVVTGNHRNHGKCVKANR